MTKQWLVKEDLKYSKDGDVAKTWIIGCVRKQDIEQVLIFSEPEGFPLS